MDTFEKKKLSPLQDLSFKMGISSLKNWYSHDLHILNIHILSKEDFELSRIFI